MIVGPTITLEDRRMDENPNAVQQVPGVEVDTGPQPIDVLEARMTLLERDLMDRMDQLRTDLQRAALESTPARLQQWVDSLQLTEARLQQVRQLRRNW